MSAAWITNAAIGAGDEMRIAVPEGLVAKPDLAPRGKEPRRDMESSQLAVVEHGTAEALTNRSDGGRRLSRENPPDRARPPCRAP